MVSVSLDMLEDSLIKKIEIMKKIVHANERQKEILGESGMVNEEEFDSILEEKGELIDLLLKLDDGFQTMFDKVKKEVGDNKDLYREQIHRLQQSIHEIMSLSASIEAAEHRNKRMAEEYFSLERKKMGYSRQTSAAAYNYYQTMSNYKDVPPQFIDNKN